MNQGQNIRRQVSTLGQKRTSSEDVGLTLGLHHLPALNVRHVPSPAVLLLQNPDP